MKKIFLTMFCIIAVLLQLHGQKVVRVGAFNFYPAIFKDVDGEIKGQKLRDFKPLSLHYDKSILADFDNKDFKASSIARFRREDGFYLCSIKYGNVIELENNIAEFLIKHQNEDSSFNLEMFGKDNKGLMVYYFVKDLIVSTDKEFNMLRSKSKIGEGLGFDPMSLPSNDAITLD